VNLRDYVARPWRETENVFPVETGGQEKSLERIKHHIMEQILRIRSQLKPRPWGQFSEAKMFQAAEESRKMYTIGANRETCISALPAVRRSYAIGCDIVLLALDVHYASA
jgi:hypothetical protein